MTRRAQWLKRWKRYWLKSMRFAQYRYKQTKDADGKTIGAGPREGLQRGPKMQKCRERVRKCTAELLPLPGYPHSIGSRPVGYKYPPSVDFVPPQFPRGPSGNSHSNFARIGFHRKPLRAHRRLKVLKRTKRDRQVTGCNFFYFMNGCFSDTDVLGRHPNETDIANGAPYPTTLWPEPLGY